MSDHEAEWTGEIRKLLLEVQQQSEAAAEVGMLNSRTRLASDRINRILSDRNSARIHQNSFRILSEFCPTS